MLFLIEDLIISIIMSNTSQYQSQKGDILNNNYFIDCDLKLKAILMMEQQQIILNK